MRKTTWTILIYTAAMGGLALAVKDISTCEPDDLYCGIGEAVLKTGALAAIFVLWIVGLIVLAIVWFRTRPSELGSRGARGQRVAPLMRATCDRRALAACVRDVGPEGDATVVLRAHDEGIDVELQRREAAHLPVTTLRTTTLPGAVREAGTVTVRAAAFADALGALSGDDVSLTAQAAALRLRDSATGITVTVIAHGEGHVAEPPASIVG